MEKTTKLIPDVEPIGSVKPFYKAASHAYYCPHCGKKLYSSTSWEKTELPNYCPRCGYQLWHGAVYADMKKRGDCDDDR